MFLNEIKPQMQQFPTAHHTVTLFRTQRLLMQFSWIMFCSVPEVSFIICTRQMKVSSVACHNNSPTVSLCIIQQLTLSRALLIFYYWAKQIIIWILEHCVTPYSLLYSAISHRWVPSWHCARLLSRHSTHEPYTKLPCYHSITAQQPLKIDHNSTIHHLKDGPLRLVYICAPTLSSKSCHYQPLQYLSSGMRP